MKKPTLIGVPSHGAKGTGAEKEEEEMVLFYKNITIDTLARTIWGEARSEGTSGMEAVASVILNRVRVAQDAGGKFWWGSNIIQVCQKPYQFSCWNRSDPNYQKLQSVTEKDLYFATALRIARRAVEAKIADQTGGATHYHTTDILPYWAKGEAPSATIRRHVFYKMTKG